MKKNAGGIAEFCPPAPRHESARTISPSAPWSSQIQRLKLAAPPRSPVRPGPQAAAAIQGRSARRRAASQPAARKRPPRRPSFDPRASASTSVPARGTNFGPAGPHLCGGPARRKASPNVTRCSRNPTRLRPGGPPSRPARSSAARPALDGHFQDRALAGRPGCGANRRCQTASSSSAEPSSRQQVDPVKPETDSER